MSELDTIAFDTGNLAVDSLTPDRLARLSCPPSAKTEVLSPATVDRVLGGLAGWQRDGDAIERRFRFANWLETLAFVTATGWVAHREDHHPDLQVSYRHCHVRFTTHHVGGLSINDLICAAKVDALTEPGT